MEEELDRTVSVYSNKAKKNYKLIVCRKGGHQVIDLNDFEKDSITFGRAGDNDIVLDENIISGHHGKFLLGEGLKIVDNESTNGLFINGNKASEKILSNGDEVKIDNPNTSLEQAVIMTVVLGDTPELCPYCKKDVVKKEEPVKEEVKEVIKCPKCGEEISEGKDFCANCGTKKDAIIEKVCAGCGRKIDNSIKFCPSCGGSAFNDVNSAPVVQPIYNSAPVQKKSYLGLIIGGVCGVFALILLIVGILVVKGINDYNNLPIKVDITMNSYYGSIEPILNELGLDFDSVTSGGNCFTGTQYGTFDTKKYGVLHTEFSYCKSNTRLTFRVYNSEKDQKLRDPRPGELAEFDSYGKKKAGI